MVVAGVKSVIGSTHHHVRCALTIAALLQVKVCKLYKFEAQNYLIFTSFFRRNLHITCIN